MPSDTVLHSLCQKTSGCIRFCQITFTIMLKDTKNKGNNLNLMKVYREQKRTQPDVFWHELCKTVSEGIPKIYGSMFQCSKSNNSNS